MRVRYTRQARLDLADIHDHIATDNPPAARRLEDYIRAAVAMLETYPGLGVTTDEPEVRRLPIGCFPYTVFYQIAHSEGEVHILRVMHGARVRDLGKLP